MQYDDHRIGTGADLKVGDKIAINFVGVDSNGYSLGNTWADRDAVTLVIGGENCWFEGWTQGIPGMKNGGRRELKIPPHLGFSPEDRPSLISPAASLIYIIDVMWVLERASTPAVEA